MGSLYGRHWSTTGEGVPDYDEPDEAVYLPGRNVLLIGVTAVWCALNDVSSIAIGSLDDNPFPDATPGFFEDYGRLLSGALAHPLDGRGAVPAAAQVRDHRALSGPAAAPDADLHGAAGARRRPVHCGACNKCRERREAFRAAGVADRTIYAA